MATNKLLKHLLGYVVADGNAGLLVTSDTVPVGGVNFTTIGSTMVRGVCTDWSGNVFLTDEDQNIIIKVTEGGQASRFAGRVGITGRANGDRDTATFSGPTGIACDRSGNIYVADTGNNQIRKIDPNGNVSLLAGSATSSASGVASGANFDARFTAPKDVTVDYSGNIFVADSGNNKIRVITGTNTYNALGSPTGVSGDILGQGDAARFSNPSGICCDKSGNLYISDSGNKKIKIVRPDYTAFKVIGPEFHTGDNFNVLEYIKVDASGFIYVVDYNDVTDLSRLIKIDKDGVGEIIVDFDVTKIGIAVSPNQTVYVTQSDAELESLSSSESSLSSSSLSSLSSESSQTA